MKEVNLIPVSWLDARRRRKRVRLWAGGGSIYALALCGVLLAHANIGAGDSQPLTEEIGAIRARAQQSSQAAMAVQRDLARAKGVLNASQAVSDQPDWSIVLALLARRLGDEAMLRRVDLRPIAGATPSPSAAGAGCQAPYLLKLSGCGRSPEAVSRFVLALERTGTFDQVKTIKASREPFQEIEVVGFQVECAVGGKACDLK
jgi:Tfp pilus assembly protein PilN